MSSRTYSYLVIIFLFISWQTDAQNVAPQNTLAPASASTEISVSPSAQELYQEKSLFSNSDYTSLQHISANTSSLTIKP